MKVFVVQENPKLNYVDAERFGEIVFMTSKEFSPIRNSLMNGEIIKDVQTFMKEFNPDKDFLLLTGGPVLLGYAFHLAISKKGYLTVLQWDGIKQAYLPIQFNP